VKPSILENTLAAQLLARPGWSRSPRRPGCYLHADTGLQILVFAELLTVGLGPDPDAEGRSMAVKAAFYPVTAIETLLEVADALVLKRTIDTRRGRPRKRGVGMPTPDMLLLLCGQLGMLTPEQAAVDPQWMTVAGWARQPALSTMVRGVYDLKQAGLVTTNRRDRGSRLVALTTNGWLAAAEVAERLGLKLPEPVDA
jgi:hypothetical protein